MSGLPRSGTSMMMKMLEAGGLTVLTDNLRTADSDNPRGYYEFESVKMLKNGNDAWLPDAQGKVVKIIATLLPYLPKTYAYRIIFMRRAIPETLASQKKMLINRGEDPDKISDDALSKIFEHHLHQVENWMSDQPNVEQIKINYNQLLENPSMQIERLNQFFGSGLDIKKMREVVDPTLYRQRKHKPQ